MFQNAFTNLDGRRWFDRMFPQTLSIAVILLYLDGFFGFLGFLDGTGIEGAWRSRGGLGALAALVAVALCPVGGFLMANGKLLGWYLAVIASFAPLALRIGWKFLVNDAVTLRTVVIGTSYASFAFEAALCALLLHRMSTEHARRWFR